MKIKSNLPTIFASRVRLNRRNEDAKICPDLYSKVSIKQGRHEWSRIDWEADGLEISEDSMRYSDEEVKRVTYNRDLVEAAQEFEAQRNKAYFKERTRLWRNEVSSVEFCNFVSDFEYETAKDYRELIPFLSLESIKKHYDFLSVRGLKRPVRARLKRLTDAKRVSSASALSPCPAFSQFANTKIARSEV